MLFYRCFILIEERQNLGANFNDNSAGGKISIFWF